MQQLDLSILKDIYVPESDSHKGQNGKVLVIGGSHLFHSSAFWALEIASKIVDMVYFSSTPVNNEIVKKLKSKFVNGIIVPREKLEDYIAEADSILIGPGLPRPDGMELGDDDTKVLTEKWLMKFPNKKWVVDGGSLQVIDPTIIPNTAIITPNKKEFKMLFGKDLTQENVILVAHQYDFTILAKGEKDFVVNKDSQIEVIGGNAGLTKGGTGDVLAGLVASFYAKNDAFLSACAASFVNKKAGESLFEKVGLYYNASDLVEEVPHVLEKLI